MRKGQKKVFQIIKLNKMIKRKHGSSEHFTFPLIIYNVYCNISLIVLNRLIMVLLSADILTVL